MKHVKKIDEIKGAKFNPKTDEYMFNPSDFKETVKFILHRGHSGFAMDISVNDREELEEILKRNNIKYSFSGEPDLPF